jgi:hypothetical protein
LRYFLELELERNLNPQISPISGKEAFHAKPQSRQGEEEE